MLNPAYLHENQQQTPHDVIDEATVNTSYGLQRFYSDASNVLNTDVIPFDFRKLVSQHAGLQVILRAKLPLRDLSDALAEFDQAAIEAEEEGFAIPSDLAIFNAKRLLRMMYEISPQRFEVYPTPDAEIAIRALAPRRSVILLCDSLGGTLCLVNLNSGRRRKRYPNIDALPDSFLGKALLDLKGESI